MNRRHALGVIASLGPALLLPPAARSAAPPLTARQVFASIKAATKQPWNPNPTDDRIHFGELDWPVTGIATCFYATMDILAEAQRAGLNYIIPHECTFYERYDDLAQSILADDDPTLSGKLKYLRDHRMIVQRMHSHSHSLNGDLITTGLLEQLGWTAYRIPGAARGACRIPEASAMEVGRHIKAACGRRTLRMFGDPSKRVSVVNVSAGMPGENSQIEQIEQQGVDAVLLGEVREPEVIGYAQDLAERRGVVVYLNGHTAEDYGMRLLAGWLGGVFPGMPVRWIPVPDPYVNPA